MTKVHCQDNGLKKYPVPELLEYVKIAGRDEPFNGCSYPSDLLKVDITTDSDVDVSDSNRNHNALLNENCDNTRGDVQMYGKPEGHLFTECYVKSLGGLIMSPNTSCTMEMALLQVSDFEERSYSLLTMEGLIKCLCRVSKRSSWKHTQKERWEYFGNCTAVWKQDTLVRRDAKFCCSENWNSYVRDGKAHMVKSCHIGALAKCIMSYVQPCGLEQGKGDM